LNVPAEIDGKNTGDEASTVSKAAPVSRIFFLDNLRVLLAFLVVLDHAAQPYVPGSAWVIPSEPGSPLESFIITMFLILISSFFMGLFFMISAYFVPPSLERKGAALFMKDRLVKLGVPILIFMFGVFPVIGYVLYYYGLYNQPQPLITFGNLWFLALLLLFSAACVAFWLVKKSPSKTRRAFPGTKAILGFILILAFLSFIVGIWWSINEWVPLGLFEPFHLTQYAMLFAAGIIAYREGWMDAIPKTAAKLWSGIAVFTVLFLIVISLWNRDALLLGGIGPGSLVGSFWQAFFCVSTCIALLAFFRDRFNSQGPLAKVLANNSYTVYIIQLPIIIFLQFLLIGVEIDPLIKFIIVGAVGIPLVFATSHYAVRRLPYAKKILG
jgi:glucan biosynthesis protein C